METRLGHGSRLAVFALLGKSTHREGKFYYGPLIPKLQPLLPVSSRGENSVHQIQYREMNSCLKADDLDLQYSSGL